VHGCKPLVHDVDEHENLSLHRVGGLFDVSIFSWDAIGNLSDKDSKVAQVELRKWKSVSPMGLLRTTTRPTLNRRPESTRRYEHLPSR